MGRPWSWNALTTRPTSSPTMPAVHPVSTTWRSESSTWLAPRMTLRSFSSPPKTTSFSPELVQGAVLPPA
jgi:hypothetical protein